MIFMKYKVLVKKKNLNTKEEIIVQAGGSADYKSEKMKIFDFISYEEMNDYIDLRQKYRNKLRNCKDENSIKEYKSKISDCSLILKKNRYDLKIANQIIEDIPKIKEIIQIERNMRNQEFEVQKNKKKNMEK